MLVEVEDSEDLCFPPVGPDGMKELYERHASLGGGVCLPLLTPNVDFRNFSPVGVTFQFPSACLRSTRLPSRFMPTKVRSSRFGTSRFSSVSPIALSELSDKGPFP